MGIIKREIEEMRKDQLIVCHNCRGTRIHPLRRYEIDYDKNEFAKCSYCNRIMTLSITSFDSLLRLIDKGIENSNKKRLGWWRRNIASLEDTRREVLRRKDQINPNN